MAGHSKRHNIRHKKAKTDAAKAKVYAKISKIITMAAKEGADPSLNPTLETALQKAKANSLPKHVIEKAIAKGAGTDGGADYVEQYYEGYGPGGVALYIRALTDNTNRSSAHIRAILTKYGCSLGAPGSVSRQFAQKGEITITGWDKKTIQKGNEVVETQPLDPDRLEEDVMETSAMDVAIDGETAIVMTAKEDFVTVLHQLQEMSYHIDDASLRRYGDNDVLLDEETEQKLMTLIDALNDDDDVDDVFHNAG